MYIQTNEKGEIIQFISIGEMPKENGYEISDETPEEVIRHIFDYKYIDGEFVLKENAYTLRLHRIREAKISSMSTICHDLITNGFDYTDGHHYSLKETDQLSLSTLSVKAAQGMETSWHYDGGNCQVYTPEEMQSLTEYAFNFIIYHQTYFNQLKSQINNMTDVKEIVDIQYGEQLDEPYNDNLSQITGGYEPDFESVSDDFDYNILMYDIDYDEIVHIEEIEHGG